MSGKPISARKDLKCPFFQKTLEKVCHQCALYISIQQGDNPPVLDCSFALAPFYQIQAAKVFHDGTVGLQASFESLRNEAAASRGAPRIASSQPLREELTLLPSSKAASE